MNGYILKNNETVFMPENFFNKTAKKFYKSFSLGLNLKPVAGEKNKILFGNADYLQLGEKEEFAINVKESGISIIAKDEKTLMRGFLTLLMRFEPYGEPVNVPVGEVRGEFKLPLRFIHVCIFPETTLNFFYKTVMLSALCGYTHVIIEFWGTIKLNSFPEYAWKNAFTKKQIKKLVLEANDLGIEIVPMFNHFGHASASRHVNGKHVILDTCPTLAKHFTPDGWAWNIKSQETLSILKNIRLELNELCGSGKYFHLGLDEAYIYGNEYLPKTEIAEFLKYLTEETIKEGRTPIIWGDMLLSHEGDDLPKYYACNEKSGENAKLLRNAIAKGTIIADWQYEEKEDIFKSSVVFKKENFEVFPCPWYSDKNIDSSMKTVESLQLGGSILTTWHTLYQNMPIVLYNARVLGLPENAWSKYSNRRSETAVLFNKIPSYSKKYKDLGFAERQINVNNS